MTVAAIICELNPAHNGHKYIFDKAREITGADYIIAIMSGSFVQRGEPAVYDKHTRTKMAIKLGADAVFELPGIFATGSAEYFARGAIALLNQLKCVDYLCFGSESGSINNILENDVRTPNDILGKEYLKALLFFSSDIKPVPIKRIGTDYHDILSVNNSICSASYLRSKIESAPTEPPTALYNLIPTEITGSEEIKLNTITPLFFDDFSDCIISAIYTAFHFSKSPACLDTYFDVYTDLSNKMLKNIYDYNNATDYCHILKTKEISFAHIKRALTHIMLGYTKEDEEFLRKNNYISYIRLLGFKKNSNELLNVISQNSKKPVISKLADAKDILSDEELIQLKKDIDASMLYEYVRHKKDGKPLVNEYRIKIVIE